MTGLFRAGRHPGDAGRRRQLECLRHFFRLSV